MKMKRILALLCAAATLTLSCKKSSSDPAPGPESKDFTIEQTDLTQGSFGVRITPKDNEGTYYFNVISKEDFAKLYSSDSDKLTAALQGMVRADRHGKRTGIAGHSQGSTFKRNAE